MELLTFPVEAKRVRLVSEFGEKGFDYAGNGVLSGGLVFRPEGDSGETQ
jgi:hypothetical protein